MRMSKPWLPIDGLLEGACPIQLHGEMGVFQLADGAGEILFIGYAGGASRYGLRGEVIEQSQRIAGAVSIRFEVTTAYLTRYQELLMLHAAEYGRLPPENPPIALGRLSPA